MRIGIFRNPLKVSLTSLLAFLFLSGCLKIGVQQGEKVPEFQGQRAYQDVLYQLSLGPRIPGTEGHDQVVSWIESELKGAGWQVDGERTEINNKSVRNIIASRGGAENYILVGAHYDSRIYADQDPDQSLRGEPMPGANDGASGVAVLLELARILPAKANQNIKLVFFDAEDNGGIADWDWILGSQAYVRDAKVLPAVVVIVDMIGDADLQIYYERNSDPALREEIWRMAASLGYGDVFIPEERHSMLDDHTPFLEAGIPAVDIIDFDYPYWHTTSDTGDKVSPASLKAVGETLENWIIDFDSED